MDGEWEAAVLPETGHGCAEPGTRITYTLPQLRPANMAAYNRLRRQVTARPKLTEFVTCASPRANALQGKVIRS